MKWVDHALGLRLRREIFCYRRSVLCVAVHAYGQGLDAAQHKEAIQRAGHRTHRVLQEGQPIVQLTRAHYDRASDHIRVAAQVLGRRVDHQVRT